MEPKTIKELRGLGVAVVFQERLAGFQNDYHLSMLEMVILLQSYQTYILDMIAFGSKEDE